MKRYESKLTPRNNLGVSYESQEAADEQARQMDLNFCSRCSYCSGCSYCSDCENEKNKSDIGPAPASKEEAVANLDKVREIILDNEKRLNMGHWHGDDEWKERTRAEETICGTTHCLAGWLQVCSTDPEIRALESAQSAGFLAAPIACGMFFQSSDRTLAWLREREYAKEEA